LDKLKTLYQLHCRELCRRESCRLYNRAVRTRRCWCRIACHHQQNKRDRAVVFWTAWVTK